MVCGKQFLISGLMVLLMSPLAWPSRFAADSLTVSEDGDDDRKAEPSGAVEWIAVREAPRFGVFGTMVFTDAWGDSRDLLIWSAVIPRVMTYSDAIQFCASQGSQLPSQEDFWALSQTMGVEDPNGDGSSSADLHRPGYLASLVDWKNEPWFWTSTVVPEYPDFAYSFYSFGGSLRLQSRLKTLAVRCVQRVVHSVRK